MSRLVVAKQKAHRQTDRHKMIELVDDGYKMRFRHIHVISLGLELVAIRIKANKFSILYIVNKRHDITEHKNQQL